MAIRIAMITPAATPAAVSIRLSVSGSIWESLALNRPLMRCHLVCEAASGASQLALLRRLVLRLRLVAFFVWAVPGAGPGVVVLLVSWATRRPSGRGRGLNGVSLFICAFRLGVE